MSQPKEDAPVSENTEPMISVSSLRKLADESKHCGADRYAEAYRLVADRLEEVSRLEHPTGSPAPGKDWCAICHQDKSNSDHRNLYSQKFHEFAPIHPSARVDSPAEGAEHATSEMKSVHISNKLADELMQELGFKAGDLDDISGLCKKFNQVWKALLWERERAERLQSERDEAKRQCANEVKIAQREIELREKAEAELAELRKQVQELKDLPAKNLPRLVVCAVIIRDGKVLLERRAPSGIEGLDNKWDLPGGKVECGEEPYDAIIREISEELYIGIRPDSFLIPYLPISTWVYADGERRHWILAAYRCTITNGEPVCSESLQWFDVNNLPSDILTADKKIITLAKLPAPPGPAEKEGK